MGNSKGKFSEKPKNISREEEMGVLERGKLLKVTAHTQMGKQQNKGIYWVMLPQICSATRCVSFCISVYTSV